MSKKEMKVMLFCLAFGFLGFCSLAVSVSMVGDKNCAPSPPAADASATLHRHGR